MMRRDDGVVRWRCQQSLCCGGTKPMRRYSAALLEAGGWSWTNREVADVACEQRASLGGWLLESRSWTNRDYTPVVMARCAAHANTGAGRLSLVGGGWS
ncbi:hypothetical protein SESBI_07899 [Sesbania bispinosa]|nr:hypothetical protein SESBI_07899 [Sesbania bispinosa]